MHLNLDIPIKYVNGQAWKHSENGAPVTLGDALAWAAGFGGDPHKDRHWPHRMAVRCNGGGPAELGTSDVAKLLECIPRTPQLPPWAHGPLFYLLGETVDDAEALAIYGQQYGDRPHEAPAGNGTGEAPAPN